MKTLLALTMITLPALLPAYEKAMDRTPKNRIEVKTVPAMTVLETRSDGSYFDEDNHMFRKLFRYISDHEISMTTPVTVDVNPGAMRFMVSEDEVEKAARSTEDVKIVTLPERQVVSIGYHGKYSEKNYEHFLEKLQVWLEENRETYRADGEPVAVYWDGPFKLNAWKKAEVMIPVVKLPGAGK